MIKAPQIIIKSRDPSFIRLPGTVVLPDARKNTTLGSGSITSIISSGGSAIIYEIWNEDLEVSRAVKLLHPDHSLESEERFQTEMKITAKLHHPNIVEIYAVGKWSGLPYIEMERIDGLTLEKLIEERGALPLEVCTSIAIMVGRALNYAHNQDYMLYGKQYHGIIHRDLKPSNIMIDKKGMVKLMDFGIAKPVTATMHTCEGAVVGTMQYLPPEQLNGEVVDVRADIYSLGTVLYEMISGARTFPEMNLAKLVTDKLSNNYAPLEQYNRKVPQKLRALVQQCLHFEKEKRVNGALSFLKGLSVVHKSLTDCSPEQVLEHFMRTGANARSTISLRKKTKVIPVMIWSATLVLMICSAATIFALVTPDAQIPHFLKSIFNAKVITPVTISTLILQATEPLAYVKDEHQPMVQSDIPVVNILNPKINFKSQKSPDGNVALAKKVRSSKLPAYKEEIIATATVDKKDGSGQQKVNLVDRLIEMYGTQNRFAIIAGEIEQAHFSNAREIFTLLSKDDARSVRGTLYKMRILKGLGDKRNLSRFINSVQIDDAELYVERASLSYEEANYNQAIENLKKAATLPTLLTESTTIRQNILYYSALSQTALYDQNPGVETKRLAMDCWFNVKSLVRTSPDHPYFVKADSEIRRIDRGQSIAISN